MLQITAVIHTIYIRHHLLSNINNYTTSLHCKERLIGKIKNNKSYDVNKRR